MYKDKTEYNSAAHLIGERIGVPVTRFTQPPERVRIPSGILTIANPVCFRPIESL